MHTDTETTNKQIDWQGHRGARGLLPENTIPSFLKALEYDIQTLELDVAVSKDSKIIVSHEPWFSHHICKKPDGSAVKKSEEKELKIYEMTYEEIKSYDCGSRGNERFEDQKPMKVHKPSFKDMVKAVDEYCKKNGRALPNFNGEIKSQPNYYGIFSPSPRVFVKLMLKEINDLSIKDRVNLQSFDFNILREIKEQDAEISMAMLIDNTKSVAANLKDLGFTPPIYSPYYKLLNQRIIKEIHDKGMRVIPWTVNETLKMKQLVEQGVDGIITDYPNRIPK
ncbi:MAG: glycerophosphodiester phosphodiesterase family protein [Saprospiraceae bacterium]